MKYVWLRNIYTRTSYFVEKGSDKYNRMMKELYVVPDGAVPLYEELSDE